MGLFNKKKMDEPRQAVCGLSSLFMNDESEGDHSKEAMLDYQLSYLLRLANTSEFGDRLARHTLMKLIEETPILNPYGYVRNLNIESGAVWKQWQHIDLIAEVSADCGAGVKKHVIVIENKAYTCIHDNQLNRYKQIVEDYYHEQEVIIHYWVITFYDNDSDGFESIAKQCEESGCWKCLSFEDVVDLTDEERQEGTHNEIIDEFWIKKWY